MLVKNKIIAKPLLKWAGGKTQLLSEIDDRLLEDFKNGCIKNYCEPFLGGAAVFFYISQKYNIEKAVLSDINEEIILFYKVIKNNPYDFINEIEGYKNKYNSLNCDKQKEFYYEIRELFNKTKTELDFLHYDEKHIKRAAQILFLNKTCYNGLYRQNSKGEFNVPFGKYENPKFYEKDNVILISKLLKNAELYAADFEFIEDKIDNSFFVYFDPPYRPISKTSSFTSYSKSDFDDKQQIRLAQLIKRLDKKGIKFLLSNSDPKNYDTNDIFFENLYSEFKIERVYAKRMINCNGNNRGNISELIIRNY